MFGLHSNNDKETSRKHEKLLKEMLIHAEKQEENFKEFCSKLGICEEELNNYLNNEDNFDEDTWKLLIKLRSDLAANLQAKIDQFVDPGKTRETYSNMKDRQQWLIVR